MAKGRCSLSLLTIFELDANEMLNRRFAKGDRVIVVGGGANENLRPGVYIVVRLLPLSSLGFQYRVKSALDTHERVFDEYMLRLASQ
jgi:hypothetical protein